jgi:hypothetical protein
VARFVHSVDALPALFEPMQIPKLLLLLEALVPDVVSCVPFAVAVADRPSQFDAFLQNVFAPNVPSEAKELALIILINST